MAPGVFGAPGGGSGAGAAGVRGTGSPPYRPVQVREPEPGGGMQTVNYISICKMPEYHSKCFEELRYEDYAKGNKAGYSETDLSNMMSSA